MYFMNTEPTNAARAWRVYLALVCLFIAVTACSGYARQNNKGNNLISEQDLDLALEAYQSAQVIEPDRAEAYFNAAIAYYELGQPDRAISNLNQALVTANASLAFSAWFNLGVLHFELGACGDAFESFKNALRLRPDDVDTRHNLELAHLCNIPATPTALEQQTNPEINQSDPSVTPTDQPGGFDGPTPTPPPIAFDLTQTRVAGEGDPGQDDSSTPVPQSSGEMTIEQAERLLDQIEQDQQALQEFLQIAGSDGDISEKDW